MANIVVIDDDYGSEILVEHLGYLGHDVIRMRSVDEALSEINELCGSDLLILDIIMEPATSAPSASISGGRTAGMTVYRKVRKKNQDLPIIVYTASSDSDISNVLERDANSIYQSKWESPSLSEFADRVQHILGLEQSKPAPQSFIVHGHDENAKLDLKNYLQNTLQIPEPIILHEQPNLGRAIIEKFEHYAAGAQLAFILLTPDDITTSTSATNDEKRRARQNVIFELGYFLGAFGRLSGQVLLLHKGPIELPNDISGLTYIDISSGIESVGEQIRRELRHVIQ